MLTHIYPTNKPLALGGGGSSLTRSPAHRSFARQLIRWACQACREDKAVPHNLCTRPESCSFPGLRFHSLGLYSPHCLDAHVRGRRGGGPEGHATDVWGPKSREADPRHFTSGYPAPATALRVGRERQAGRDLGVLRMEKDLENSARLRRGGGGERGHGGGCDHRNLRSPGEGEEAAPGSHQPEKQTLPKK